MTGLHPRRRGRRPLHAGRVRGRRRGKVRTGDSRRARGVTAAPPARRSGRPCATSSRTPCWPCPSRKPRNTLQSQDPSQFSTVAPGCPSSTAAIAGPPPMRLFLDLLAPVRALAADRAHLALENVVLLIAGAHTGEHLDTRRCCAAARSSSAWSAAASCSRMRRRVASTVSASVSARAINAPMRSPARTFGRATHDVPTPRDRRALSPTARAGPGRSSGVMKRCGPTNRGEARRSRASPRSPGPAPTWEDDGVALRPMDRGQHAVVHDGRGALQGVTTRTPALECRMGTLPPAGPARSNP